MNALTSKFNTEFQDLLKAHHCTITPHLEFKRDAQIELIHKLIRHKKTSYTVFDLHHGKFICNLSAYEKFFSEPCSDCSQDDNTNCLFELIHPNDRAHVLNSKIKAYNHLMDLPVEKHPDFRYRFPCRIETVGGEYQLFIHSMSVMLSDDAGIPWLILIVTERAPHCCCNEDCLTNLKQFLTGNSLIDNFNISNHQLRILGMVYEGHNQTEIANILNSSTNTIQFHYAVIRKNLNAKTIRIAAVYAKIIGILNAV